MTNTIITPKNLNLLLAITIALLTTGYLRLQLASGLPEYDGGFYTFTCSYIYQFLTNAELTSGTPLLLYQFLTAWVYGLDINQYITLRLIDGVVAIAASIILFKVILKESGSTLFTVILVTTLLIIMNDIEVIAFGFRNSIWAAYLPLFSALLVWQNSTKEDKYSFYLIGGLVSLGVLFREPFLPFFLLATIAIYISYGWRALVKYLIGAAVIGFSVVAVMLSFRGWDLFDLIDSYVRYSIGIAKIEWKFPLMILESFWFIFLTAIISITYLLKLYWGDKKLTNMNRFYFWLAVAVLPIIEYYSKLGLLYHFSNCLIGFAGLSAMGWKYININESKKTQASAMMFIGILSLVVILPTLNEKIVQKNRIHTLSDASRWIKNIDAFRSKNTVERSQIATVAKQIYNYSREDSTLSTSGYWSPVYPLTGLSVPLNNKLSEAPAFFLYDLRALAIFLDSDEDRLIQVIKDYRPTIIVVQPHIGVGELSIPPIVEKTNLYEIIARVPPRFSYEDFFHTHKIQKIDPNVDAFGWMEAIVYRLKDFK